MDGQHGDDDLHLVAQPGHEGRAQRPVDQPAGEDGLGAGAAFAAEERAGNAPGSVHPLLDIDGEWEEVEVFFRLLGRGRGGQQHRFAVQVGADATGRLPGQPAGLEADGAGAERAVVDHGFGGGDIRTLQRVPPWYRSEGTFAGCPVLDQGPRNHWFRKPLPRTGRAHVPGQQQRGPSDSRDRAWRQRRRPRRWMSDR